MTTVADHDAYIAAAPEALRPLLERLRARLAEALPDAEPVIEYGMPGFRIGTSIVAGYAAFSRQCGLYVQAGAIAACAEDIAAAGLKATKTGVTFSPEKPMPDDLAGRLARASRDALGCSAQAVSPNRRTTPPAAAVTPAQVTAASPNQGSATASPLPDFEF